MHPNNNNWFQTSPFPQRVQSVTKVESNPNDEPFEYEDRQSHPSQTYRGNRNFFLTPTNKNSPWILNQREKFDNFHLPNLLSNVEINGRINHRISFSDDEDPQTPILHEDRGQVHPKSPDTTARKGSCAYNQNLFSKKSRVRDKGLRKLSERAYDIVLQLKAASYKEVAEKLVTELSYESSLDDDGKDEKNVKRRVYDALNVLIALGVLRKHGRKITGEKRTEPRHNSSGKEMTKEEQGAYLQKKLEIQGFCLAKKTKTLQEIEEKYQSIKLLIKRNQHQPATQGIRFPFIGAITDFKHNNSDADNNIQFSEGSFQMRCSQPIHPFGDIDTVSFLKKSLRKSQSDRT